MEQNVYDYLKSLQGENFHLKNQLSRRNKEIRGYKQIIKQLKDKLEAKEKKAHYRNARKKGRHGRNG